MASGFVIIVISTSLPDRKYSNNRKEKMSYLSKEGVPIHSECILDLISQQTVTCNQTQHLKSRQQVT